MSAPREGARVSYIGRPENGPEMGSEGRLLAITGSGGHVKWASGALTYADLDDLVVVDGSCTDHFGHRQPNNFHATTSPEELDDSLEFTAGFEGDDDLFRDSLGDF